MLLQLVVVVVVGVVGVGGGGGCAYPVLPAPTLLYPHLDPTLKSFHSPLVLTATARSRSDPTNYSSNNILYNNVLVYGVTFDMGSVLKGSWLNRGGGGGSRKQFRLVFSAGSSGSGNVSSSCRPPYGHIKTGRKYILYISQQQQGQLVALYSPDPATPKNIHKVLTTTSGRHTTACGSSGGNHCPPPVGVVPEVVVVVVGGGGGKVVVLDEVVGEVRRVRVRCRVGAGWPIPALFWYKNNLLLNPPHQLTTTNNILRIKHKRRQSILTLMVRGGGGVVGEYACVAWNGVGGGSRDSITITTATTTIPPPLVVGVAAPPARGGGGWLWPIESGPCPHDSYCLNGGTCSYYDSISEYVCQCAEGYKGQRCEAKEIRSGSILSPRTTTPYHPHHQLHHHHHQQQQHNNRHHHHHYHRASSSSSSSSVREREREQQREQDQQRESSLHHSHNNSNSNSNSNSRGGGGGRLLVLLQWS